MCPCMHTCSAAPQRCCSSLTASRLPLQAALRLSGLDRGLPPGAVASIAGGLPLEQLADALAGLGAHPATALLLLATTLPPTSLPLAQVRPPCALYVPCKPTCIPDYTSEWL